MAGIDFDRQVFASAAEPPPQRFPIQAIGPALFIFALGVLALISFKIYSDNFRSAPVSPATEEVAQLRQQLAEMQKRIDQSEKHRKPASSDSAANLQVNPIAGQKAAPMRMVYRVVSASQLPAVSNNSANNQSTTAGNTHVNNAAVQNELVANREAWQATTDRLADVVGVVGTQQGEISANREALNQLLTQSKRQTFSFELQRGNTHVPVGPLTLQLKSADVKSQRYGVCVYFADKCIELKDRAVNEVVIFVVSKDSAPLELVATKIMRDQILGFVAVPAGTVPSSNGNR
jgi:hypothetical protein